MDAGPTSLIFSSVNRHLCRFPLPTAVNKASGNICVHAFVWIPASKSSGAYAGVEMPHLTTELRSTFQGATKPLATAAAPPHAPPAAPSDPHGPQPRQRSLVPSLLQARNGEKWHLSVVLSRVSLFSRACWPCACFLWEKEACLSPQPIFQ